MKIKPDKLKELNVKNAKLLKDLSEEEKANKPTPWGVPTHVVNNIKDYPDSPIHEDKNWKLIDYEEKPDGSETMTFVRDNGKIGTPEEQRMVLFNDNPSFLLKLEKNQYQEGKLKEVSEKTIELHITEGTFNESDLHSMKICDCWCNKIPMSQVAEFKGGKVKLK